MPRPVHARCGWPAPHRLCDGTDARPDVNRHPAPFLAPLFALADLDTNPDGNTARRQGGHRLQGAQGSLYGPTEKRGHTVFGVLGASTTVLG